MRSGPLFALAAIATVLLTAAPGRPLFGAAFPDGIVAFANNANTPPFITFISTSTNEVLAHYVFVGADGIEQSQYDPKTKLFFVNVVGTPAISGQYAIAFPLATAGADMVDLPHGIVLGAINVCWGLAFFVAPALGAATAQVSSDRVPYLLAPAFKRLAYTQPLQQIPQAARARVVRQVRHPVPVLASFALDAVHLRLTVFAPTTAISLGLQYIVVHISGQLASCLPDTVKS